MRGGKLIFGTFTLFVVAVTAYILRLISLQERLQVFSRVRPANITLNGMQIVATVEVKNPTRHRLSITNPFVSLFVPGQSTPFASSNPAPGVISFEPMSTNTFEVRIPVRYSDALPQVRRIIEAGRLEIDILARFGPLKTLVFSDRKTVEFNQLER